MGEINEALGPYIDWLPQEGREFLEAGGWWLVIAIVVMILLLIAGRFFRRLGRALFRGRIKPRDWDRELREILDDCPLPVRPQGERCLTVYHIPVRLRLVVVAPPGSELEVDALAVERLLDQVVPGMVQIAERDRPRIRVWPGQISQQGFINTFHRCTIKAEGDNQPSRWVLVAGRVQLGRQVVLLGLGLWAEQANSIGRLTLEPHQWLDVLRLRKGED